MLSPGIEVVSDEDTDMMVFSENQSVVAPSTIAQSDTSFKKRKQKTSTKISAIKKHQSKGIADTLSPSLD